MNRKKILENKKDRLQKILDLKSDSRDEKPGHEADPGKDSILNNTKDHSELGSKDSELGSKNSLLEQDNYPIQQTQMETFHSIVFNICCILSFVHWLYYLQSYNPVTTTALSQNRCQQLIQMQLEQPMQMKLNQKYDWWVMYLSLEVVLISIRLSLVMVCSMLIDS